MEAASLTNREEIEKKILSHLYTGEFSHYILMQRVFGIADITEINRIDDMGKRIYQKVLDNLVKEDKVTIHRREGSTVCYYGIKK